MKTQNDYSELGNFLSGNPCIRTSKRKRFFSIKRWVRTCLKKGMW